MHIKTLAIVLYAGLAAAAARPAITGAPVNRARGLDDAEFEEPQADIERRRVRPRAPQASEYPPPFKPWRREVDFEEPQVDKEKRHVRPRDRQASEVGPGRRAVDFDESLADIEKRHPQVQAPPAPSPYGPSWKRVELEEPHANMEKRQPRPENLEPTRTKRSADDLERRRAQPPIEVPSGSIGNPPKGPFKP